MPTITDRYRDNLALLTALYQLTMAYGYWKTGKTTTESIFHLFFRSPPFEGGFTINCGLFDIINFLENFTFTEDDIAYLSSIKGNDHKPLFESDFLTYLANLKFCCNVDAIPEGSVVFPHEPLLRIQGALIQCQLALLTILNFQTLIATKTARVCLAAQGDPLLEFGLRRAQGIDDGISASRAAYIGEVAAKSNILAGKLFGIPVKGTHETIPLR